VVDERTRKVRLAAADKESAQFALDNADADLRDAIREALAEGAPVADLAESSDLPPHKIKKLGRSAS
jgi:hypothetical protein